jgi:Uma2 family endonuclease
MIAVKESFPRFTPEEYFKWEEQQQLRHEYINGEVDAMTGGTLNHSEIASNFNFHFQSNEFTSILILIILSRFNLNN